MRNALAPFSVALIALCLSGSAPVRCIAGDETPYQTYSTQNVPAREPEKEVAARSFAAICETLAAENKICLLAEDGTMSDPLSQKRFAALKESLQGAGLSTQQKIKLLAAAFDYAAKIYKKNIFVLTKRLSEPNDLPDVTLDEWQQTLQQSNRVLTPYSPDFVSDLSKDKRFRSLFRSFTQEQLRQLKSPGLPVSEVSETQRGWVEDICHFIYVQDSVERIRRVAERTRCLRDKTTRVGWFVREGKEVFGFEGILSVAPGITPAIRQFVPLGVADSVNTYIEIRPDLRVDSAATKESEDAEPRHRKLPAANTLTLKEAVLLLEQSAAQNKGKALHLTVAPALAEKRVTMAGLIYADSLTPYYALAQMYNLRIRGGNGEYVLEPRKAATAREAVQISDSLLQALPSPFLRAINIHRAVGQGPLARPFLQSKREQVESDTLFKMWRKEALRRLQESVSSRSPLANAGNKRMLIADFTPEDNIALANYMMADAAPGFSRLIWSSDAQPLISQFPQVILTGGPYQEKSGEAWFRLTLSLPRPNGTLNSYSGFSIRNVDSAPDDSPKPKASAP